MVNITIDNHTIAVPSGTTIMEAAASIHIPIPKLCYLKDTMNGSVQSLRCRN